MLTLKDTEIIAHLKSLNIKNINMALKYLYLNNEYREAAKSKAKGYESKTANFNALFEEAYSDAVIDFYERVESYDPQLSGVKSSIVRFTRTNFFTAWRAEQRMMTREQVFADSSETTPTPERILFEKERHAIGLAIFKQLGSSCRAMLILREDRKSFEKIALELGKRSTDAAKQSYYACRKKLNQLLSSQPGFLESL